MKRNLQTIINTQLMSHTTYGNNLGWVSGGDLFSVSQFLNAMNSGGASNGNTANKWVWYVRMTQFDINLADVSNDEWLEDNWKYMMRQKVDYGKVGVALFYGKKVMVGINNVQLVGLDGWKGDGYIVNTSYADAGNGYVNFTPEAKSIKVSNKNCVILRDNEYNITNFYLYQDFLDNLITNYLVANNNFLFASKKVKYIVNNDNSDVIENEISSMFNPQTNFIMEVKNNDALRYVSEIENRISGNISSNMNNIDMPNRLEPIDVGDSNLKETWEAFDLFNLFWNKVLGRPAQIQGKRERVITGEIGSMNQQSNTILGTKKYYIEKFIRQYNEMFNANAAVDFNELEEQVSGNLQSEKGVKDEQPNNFEQ